MYKLTKGALQALLQQNYNSEKKIVAIMEKDLKIIKLH